MKFSQDVMDQMQPLDYSNLERIKSEYLKIHYDISGLRFLRDRAGRERDLRELYRERAPYELLQNADDANAKRTVFILSRTGLAFAHDGDWFTVANFKSLADGWSDKNPQECIGHKGIGFRSVLDLTPSPHLIRVGTGSFFAVKFSWALNNGHIQETLHRDPTLSREYNDWTKHGQRVCPVMAIPGFAKKQTLGIAAQILDDFNHNVYGENYTTLFWFPATDPDIDYQALADISPKPLTATSDGINALVDFLKYEVCTLLPFLASVKDVSVYVDADRIASTNLLSKQATSLAEEVSVRTDTRDQVKVTTFFQMRFFAQIPPHISGKPDTPKAVRALKQAKVVLSVLLDNGRPKHDENACFHVYFPTEEKTGLGFIVHGDFYVKPDRTRLMDSAYNEWLLDKVGEFAVNGFLTQLLKCYEPRAVFEALSPQDHAATVAAENLVGYFAQQLQKCTSPFIPAGKGTVCPRDAVLPPTIDLDGFWTSHFSDVTNQTDEHGKTLVHHEIDGGQSRKFLRLAEVQTLGPEALIGAMELAAQSVKPAQWWYECYTYLASEDSRLSGKGASFFATHQLIPTDEDAVIAIPKEGDDLVVCIPPARHSIVKRVPEIFASTFVFLQPDLAQILETGPDTVRSWVLNRFRIARFEATDFLPRAVRSVGPKLFSGEIPVTATELKQAWLFIKAIVEASRGQISSPAFIKDLGRLPLPLPGALTSDSIFLDPGSLVPAFLAYWPESYVLEEGALAGIQTLRRVEAEFLRQLVAESGRPKDEWVQFFNLLGVSSSPKLLSYARLAVGGQELIFTSGAINEFDAQQFSGERQNDENHAVIALLTQEEGFWENTLRNAKLCDHNASKELQSLTVLEGLGAIADAAQQAYQVEDEHWHFRLATLIQELGQTLSVQNEPDTVFCRGGSRGGHNISIGSYLQKQLGHYSWLPSTRGPVSSTDCFVRLNSRRLISSGRLPEELGDLLLPYVVVDNINDLAKLKNLGVEPLEDPASASSAALIRALTILGQQLSTEWGQQEILTSRSRWRLVRGAIQEIYRTLNQRKEVPTQSPNLLLPIRTEGELIELRELPLYYAEPGSPVEQAFVATLPLIDADRPYPDLFDQLGILRLTPGDTVDEIFLAEASATPAKHLQRQITEELAPYLLAPIIAKGERANVGETILRRLQERFEVKAAKELTVTYTLHENPACEQTVEFPKFYMQRRVVPGTGVVQEAHFTLYVAGEASLTLFDPALDADALGASLVPVFMDAISEELAGFFPRIASRYHHCRGNAEQMIDFLHHQLKVSIEAQDMAQAIMAGQVPELLPAPPPARYVGGSDDNPHANSTITKAIQQHRKELQQQVDELFPDNILLDNIGKTMPPDKPKPDLPEFRPRRQTGGPTREQQERGKLGEEEIKRRLSLPGGWEGFVLLQDTREDGCGYDFLCKSNGQEVNLEVKTFTENGYVVVTSNELKSAARTRTDYYMVGVLSEESKPQSEWETFFIRDPINAILQSGTIHIQAEFGINAADLFRVKSPEMQKPE